MVAQGTHAVTVRVVTEEWDADASAELTVPTPDFEAAEDDDMPLRPLLPQEVSLHLTTHPERHELLGIMWIGMAPFAAGAVLDVYGALGLAYHDRSLGPPDVLLGVGIPLGVLGIVMMAAGASVRWTSQNGSLVIAY